MVLVGERDDARVREVQDACDEVRRAVDCGIDEDDMRLTERRVRPRLGEVRDRLDTPDPVESVEARYQSLAEDRMTLHHHHIRHPLAHVIRFVREFPDAATRAGSLRTIATEDARIGETAVKLLRCRDG